VAVRGIRGAIEVERNDPESIAGAARELVERMVRRNGVRPTEIAYVYFTVTPDLTADFPARAIRMLGKGWKAVPLLCSQEIPVPGSLERLLRVLMVVNTRRGQGAIEHQYLGGAARLRPDLAGRDREKRA
jgi:chorismate mutase